MDEDRRKKSYFEEEAYKIKLHVNTPLPPQHPLK